MKLLIGAVKYVRYNLNIDHLGFSASTACAIHCAIVPFFLAINCSSVIGMLHHPSIEGTALSVSVFLAVASLLPAFIRHHKSLKAITIVVVGFGLIALGQILELGTWEVLLTVPGAAMVAIAHLVNWRLRKTSARRTGI